MILITLFSLFDSLLLSFSQIEIGTLVPPDYSYPVPEVTVEEQQEEEEEEEEMLLNPQLTPQGSDGSGVLMGPDTQKGLEKRTTMGPYIVSIFLFKVGGYCSPLSYRIKVATPLTDPKFLKSSPKSSANTLFVCMSSI